MQYALAYAMQGKIILIGTVREVLSGGWVQALESGNPTEGSRVLIHGGAGGVGSFAVQLAKYHWKAYVVSTSRSTDFVKVRFRMN